MTKKYTLTTSEETVTENPEDIIRLMKLAGLENAQPVAEEVEAEVYEPTEANDELDLDDYSKKSPESISKQKKSIQPTLGDNPLEYSLDENEIYDAMMKEFPEDKVEETTEEITEKQSPAQKAAFEKMLAAKNGKKDEAVEEKEETTVEENLEKAQEEIDELKEEELKEECGCGHGSDCDCGPECDCGCNESVNEERVDEILPIVGAALGAVGRAVAGGVAKAAGGAVANAVSNAASNKVNASKKTKSNKKLNAVKEEEVAVVDEDQNRLKDLINYQN